MGYFEEKQALRKAQKRAERRELLEESLGCIVISVAGFAVIYAMFALACITNQL